MGVHVMTGDEFPAGTYNPLTGTDYSQAAAQAEWAHSMSTANYRRPLWNLRGPRPAEFYWEFFDFKPYRGTVTVEADGFHWATRDYDTDDLIHQGVTTSLYAAYQSVVQNRPVEWKPKA